MIDWKIWISIDLNHSNQIKYQKIYESHHRIRLKFWLKGLLFLTKYINRMQTFCEDYYLCDTRRCIARIWRNILSKWLLRELESFSINGVITNAKTRSQEPSEKRLLRAIKLRSMPTTKESMTEVLCFHLTDYFITFLSSCFETKISRLEI